MLRNCMLFAAVLGLVCAFVSTGIPAEEQKAAQLVGEVTKIDVKAETVVVKDTSSEKEAKEVEVTADAKTTITIDGKDAKLADLKSGDKVTVEYVSEVKEEKTVNVAKSIVVG